MASCTTSAERVPRWASRCKAAITIALWSTSKKRRNSARVSLRPKPSVPSATKSAPHERRDEVRIRAHVVGRDDRDLVASQSRLDVTRPAAALAGCSMFHRSTVRASRASSLKLRHAPHLGVDVPLLAQQRRRQPAPRGRIAPEPSSRTRVLAFFARHARMRCMPLMMSS